MSDIVEKAFFSFQNLVSGASSRTKEPAKSRGFQNLIDVVSGSPNKREQDIAIERELAFLKSKLSQPCLKSVLIRDCLIRAIYCEMLGYPAPFIYIHAIKQAQQGSLVDKRVGYLAATLFLHDNHELVILIINTIQKDLKSTNILEICMALTAATYLVSPEMIPAILDLVEEKLIHPKEMVRKKSIFALHHFLLTCPATVTHLIPRVKTCIGDRDPEVVVAALHFFTSLAKVDVTSCKDIVTPLVQIMDQVLQRKLSVDFEYHGLPAPFIQIHILRLLALLGENDEHNSALMYDVLIRTLQKVDVNHTIGHALIYECVRTAASIQPSDTLLDIVCPVIGRFLESQNNNVKYMGLKSLSCVVQKVGKKLASQHQSTIMECLRHPDATIRKKILDVLFCLANPGNFQVVCSKIIDYLSSTSDDYAKAKIVNKLLPLIQSYSSNSRWSLETLNTVMMKTSEEALPGVIQAVKNLITKESGTTNTDQEFRTFAVRCYMNLLNPETNDSTISRSVTELAIWVLKENHNRCIGVTADDVLEVVCSQLQNRRTIDANTTVSLLAALKQIVIGSNCRTDQLKPILQPCAESKEVTIKQQASELLTILENLNAVRKLFSQSEPNFFDWTLGFLDQCVVDALSTGAASYLPPSMRAGTLATVEVSGSDAHAHWPTYDALSTCSNSSKREVMSVSSVSVCSERTSRYSYPSGMINLNEIKRVWTKDGYSGHLEESKKESMSTSSNSSVVDQNLNTNIDNAANSQDDQLAKALFDDSDVYHDTAADVSAQSTHYNRIPQTMDMAQNSSRHSSDSSIQQIPLDYSTPSNAGSPLDNGVSWHRNNQIDQQSW